MESVPQPEVPLMDFLNSLDAPTLSNAIELLGVRPKSEGFAPMEIRCLFPELRRMCGYAVTAQVETVTQSHPEDGAMLLALYDAVVASAKPAVVVFQEIGGHSSCAAHCGEVMATIFQRLGAIGLATDCGVRDVPEVRSLRFHYFATGTVASHANFHIVRVGVGVQLRGLVIQPGDLLHGDENGLLLVPKEGIEHLPQAVEQVRVGERALMDYVRGPAFSIDGLKSRLLARLKQRKDTANPAVRCP